MQFVGRLQYKRFHRLVRFLSFVHTYHLWDKPEVLPQMSTTILYWWVHDLFICADQTYTYWKYTRDLVIKVPKAKSDKMHQASSMNRELKLTSESWPVVIIYSPSGPSWPADLSQKGIAECGKKSRSALELERRDEDPAYLLHLRCTYQGHGQGCLIG